MLVHSLTHSGFRNLQAAEFVPAPGVNVIYGNNAQGKTNLLEALWLFTGSRSFRGSRDGELVAFGEERAALSMAFTAQGRRQEADIAVTSRRAATVNGIPQASATALAGIFGAVVFSPAHLSLVRDGPEERRRFIDAAYCQLRPGYLKILSAYQRTLAQRNALLRRLRQETRMLAHSETQLDAWDERLAVAGAQVFAARSAYIRKLEGPAADIYAGISAGNKEGGSGGETFSIRYDSFTGADTPAREAALLLLEQIRGSRAADLAAGHTAKGPHRDNLAVFIGGRDARQFASQGQQRSAVLALKLAEAAVLQTVTEEPPVALLDDVMSELDAARQDYIFNHIGGWQVFLTCCDAPAVLRMTGGKAFYMDNGVLREGG